MTTPKYLLLLALAPLVLAACAPASHVRPPPTPPDPEAVAHRLGAPELQPEDECSAEIRNNTFPHYPPTALKMHVEGWVVVAFDLDGSGKASNVRVLASQPPGVFDESATTSVARTEYQAGARRTQCKARITFAFG